MFRLLLRVLFGPRRPSGPDLAMAQRAAGPGRGRQRWG